MAEKEALRDMIEYYREQGAPGDQQMLISLLKEAQEGAGGVLSRFTLSEISEAYGMKEALLMALVKRIPTLRYEDIPHKLEVCATCKCSGNIRDYIENTYGLSSGGSSKDAGFQYRTVNCMKNCKNGPSVKWDGQLFSRVTISLLKEIIG